MLLLLLLLLLLAIDARPALLAHPTTPHTVARCQRSCTGVVAHQRSPKGGIAGVFVLRHRRRPPHSFKRRCVSI
jgi:hypothetical protein